MGVGCEGCFAKDYLRAFEIGEHKGPGERSELGRGKPGEAFEAGQLVEISVWEIPCSIQIRTLDGMPRRYAHVGHHANECHVKNKRRVLCTTIQDQRTQAKLATARIRALRAFPGDSREPHG